MMANMVLRTAVIVTTTSFPSREAIMGGDDNYDGRRDFVFLRDDVKCPMPRFVGVLCVVRVLCVRCAPIFILLLPLR
jgi:hypothetical protein